MQQCVTQNILFALECR